MDAISNGAAAAYTWGNSLATSANGYATAKTIGGGVLNFGAVGVTIQYLWVAKSDPIDSDARTIVIILSSINLGLNILCLLLAIGLAFTKVKSPRSAEFAADLEASVADTNALDDPDHPDAVAALKASIKNIGERHEMPKSIQAAADDDAHVIADAVARAARNANIATGGKIIGWVVFVNYFLNVLVVGVAGLNFAQQYFDGQRQSYDSAHPHSSGPSAPSVPGTPL